MPGTTNADLTRIWDGAEVYVASRDAIGYAAGAVLAKIPASVYATIDPVWGFVGLIDAGNGIPVNPELEITHYDAFGQTRYRSKGRKGTISTGFTAMEENTVTRQFVLPGSAPNRIGAPKTLPFYVMYVLRDNETVTDVWVSLRPALLSLGSYTKTEGEPDMYEMTVDHANDASNDVFARIQGYPALTRSVVFTGGPFTAGTFTITVTNPTGTATTTPLAFGATAATIDAAVEALSNVGVGAATVTGSVATGLSITVPGAVTVNASSLTPTGTATVS